MTQPLLKNLPRIASSIRSAPCLLLFLDFDGTLAPIRAEPGTASMPIESRRAIQALGTPGGSRVAIISGRALPDLRERVRMEEIIYAGNHGLEISGPGLHFLEPAAAQRVEALDELARHLEVRLAHIPGAEVEGKVLTASIHFRRAHRSRLEEIRKTVQAAVAPWASLFEVTRGLEVLEIRPRVNWDKGAAVHWIKEELGQRDALPIYIGDDSTDEDAFAALPEGITVSVGRATGTCARFHLEWQESVQGFLVWLAEQAAARL